VTIAAAITSRPTPKRQAQDRRKAGRKARWLTADAGPSAVRPHSSAGLVGNVSRLDENCAAKLPIAHVQRVALLLIIRASNLGSP